MRSKLLPSRYFSRSLQSGPHCKVWCCTYHTYNTTLWYSQTRFSVKQLKQTWDLNSTMRYLLCIHETCLHLCKSMGSPNCLGFSFFFPSTLKGFGSAGVMGLMAVILGSSSPSWPDTGNYRVLTVISPDSPVHSGRCVGSAPDPIRLSPANLQGDAASSALSDKAQMLKHTAARYPGLKMYCSAYGT